MKLKAAQSDAREPPTARLAIRKCIFGGPVILVVRPQNYDDLYSNR